MISKLILTCFKQHENLTINFTAGLNCIRGANEAGKSTILEAMAFAFYGARALPMSLEETVTWEKPPSALKVELHFNHGGTDFKITRSKSGAELEGGGVNASGQAGVTAFVEKLFQVNAATAASIMLANQGAIRGAMDGGAVQLIEKLSNLDLIDSLITKIQEHLPCGNTKVLENSIIAMGVDAANPPTANFDLQEDAVLKATLKHGEASRQVAALQGSTLVEDAKQAAVRLQLAAAEASTLKALEQQRDTLKESLARTLPETYMDVESLEKKAEARRSQVEILRAFTSFNTGPEDLQIERVLADDFSAACNATASRMQVVSGRVADLRVEQATVKASSINDESCALCGKLLQDVPEVVAVNAKVSAKLQLLDNELKALTIELVVLGSDQRTQQLVAQLNSKRSTLHAIVAKYTNLDKDMVPYKLTWKPEFPTKFEADDADYALLIKQARAHNSKVDSNIAVAQHNQKALKAIELQISEPRADYDAAEDRAIVELAAAETELRNLAVIAEHRATLELNAAKFALLTAQNSFAAAMTAFEVTKKQLEDTQKTLWAYNFHNALIKKLRELRPVVAKKLWALVLTTVSTYFSNIRGVQSTVTRTDDKFLIDGKSVAAFSGSTKDSLGLAIRIALQKTFLGNIGFMLADEPAAACDDNRESDMLGLLVSCGYEQTILVTHSDLADSFCHNLVTL